MAGHVGPILKIISLEPRKIERILYGNQPHELIPDTPKIITASLDNTISLWDYAKMDTISTMESPKTSELTCITFLYRCFLVASGHEDGAIRLWNMEINSSVLLKCHDPSKKHTNTISCITSTFWKDSEFIICGSYDGKVSIWEISEKPASGQENSGFSKITPQLRHVINNKKATAPEGHADIEHQTVNQKLAKDYQGHEILVITCYEETKKDDENSKDSENETYIIVGGNNVNIQVYSIRTGLLHK
jgi:WD40 repeat protein